MKTIPHLSTPLLSTAMALGASLLFAHAQIPWATEPFSRQGKLEVYGVGQYLHQDDTTYSSSLGGTVKVKMNDTGLGGVGVAYHFSDYFSVHGDFMFGPATFQAQGPGGPTYTLGQDAYLQTGRINLDYNIINRRFTPFITAGIGYQYLQVDQNNYYYNNNSYNGNNRYYYNDYYYYNYYYETDFTWNVGAGFRWNVTDNIFIRLHGGAQWLKYQDAQNTTTQIEAFFSIGWMF